MKKDDTKVACRTPTAGKSSINIAKWKYYAVRSAILEVLSSAKAGVAFKDLPKRVSQKIKDPDTRHNLGSIPWYTTVVKLDMEVKGEIERMADSKSQRLRTAAKARKKSKKAQ